MRSDRRGDALTEILSAIDSSMRDTTDGEMDLVKIRADAGKAAKLLIDLYGNGAVERARLLERRSDGSYFAKLVRQEVEKSIHLPG